MESGAGRDLARTLTKKPEQALALWAEGFREACCIHRVFIYCLRSRQLAVRTGQCFLLNGFIFLGSIFFLQSVIVPVLQWILPDHCPESTSEGSFSCWGILEFYSFLRLGLVQLFYVFWFFPLYILSYILSNMWYNDIAKYGFFVLEEYGAAGMKSSDQKEAQTSQKAASKSKSTGFEGVMIGIAEQIYSVLLLTFFFVEVCAIGFIPYIGKTLKFLLLSWMYAYYSFEYKWSLSGLSLDKRLDFFETNWAFFADFGHVL